ncbi:tetratricopeptide repeat protein [Leptolyngbya sp. FACHB-671]|uniref:tetratricopeptide repeat protein n=1 Tax=Leptolyngbya sp. FACHB-671 TaxID=2692812 RepID=UPI001685AA89|nr:tetratricopeptide repeat protein [Leptolyngbya sp. FACHB-671]MBD2067015.1 tetratricopeptide repeat protein [Leptolyngbya sp. FACHB-671]
MGLRIARRKFQIDSLKRLPYKYLSALPLAIALLGALEFRSFAPQAAIAQEEENQEQEEQEQEQEEQEEEQFPPNPLEIDESDPLFPQLIIDRPLSPQERRVLATALDELRVQAEQELAAGNPAGAFEILNRELRLRRVLGVEEEVDSLSRVGEIAWRENQTTETRLITERLQQIEQEVQAETPPDFDLLLRIAQAYQTMRAIDPAVTLYDQILIRARQQGDAATEQDTLTALGELHLAWFDYTAAAIAYQELLTLARARGDRPREVEYLQQLAYIYQENNQPEEAIAAQQELVSVYQGRQEYALIPPLKIAIADSFQALNRPDRAATNYQEAFAVARSGQQYAYASEALQKLADLYRSLDRPDDALVVYQLLIDVEQQSYNSYGIMQAYDEIGQLQLERGNTNQAIAAFRRGLELARQLSYRESYFTQQIEAASQPPAQSNPEPAQPN